MTLNLSAVKIVGHRHLRLRVGVIGELFLVAMADGLCSITDRYSAHY